jgi:hypothetical protein
MAMLPGWPFAPSKTPGAWFESKFEPSLNQSLNNDSLDIDSLSIVLK